ncbi:DUF3052 domain-containing protein [Streptomyces antibioticus]|uniref:DUF3052 domain-containing protein n=1 Tax=Streptomyces antibioticus TaxID=1890 RepID=UPI003D707420
MATEHQTNPAARLGFQPGQVVLEIGYDDDVDHDLRKAIEEITGKDLVDRGDSVADAAVVWFREDDGYLSDVLVEAVALIEDGGIIWSMTPKHGRPGYMESSDINEAAQTAGLSLTKSVSAAEAWNGCRMVVSKPY